MLVLGPPSVVAAEEKVTGETTLQEITRDAQRRLKELDEQDAREEQMEAKYWWLGLIEMAVGIAFGRFPTAIHGAHWSDSGGLSLDWGAHRPAPATPTPPAPAPPSVNTPSK
jgi:hypothetical protein